MRSYDICDLHGHFLPDMDDGSRTVEESLGMLETAYKQGIRKMFATPHYYSDESIESFLQRREKSYELLKKAMEEKKGEYPRICLGAEVAYRRGIGNADGLEKLCLGNSGYLLLELPFAPWESALYRDLSSMTNVNGIIPVIAHIERYMHQQKQEQLDRLMQQDVLIQMNASTLLNWSSRGQARRLLEKGIVQLLGSDCHNMLTRAPNMGPALDYLEKKCLDKTLHQIATLSSEIFDEAMTER